jgi:hypothetical protein
MLFCGLGGAVTIATAGCIELGFLVVKNPNSLTYKFALTGYC